MKIGLCDIGRVRNPKKMQYTFRQQHLFGLIQCRLDYVLISRNFQGVVGNSESLGAMPTDRSALFCSFQHFNKLKVCSGLWKFNNSLVSNEDFIQKCTEHIQKVKEQLNSQNQFCDQTKWEILKYEFHLFTISFSKDLAQLSRKEQSARENRLKYWNQI